MEIHNYLKQFVMNFILLPLPLCGRCVESCPVQVVVCA